MKQVYQGSALEHFPLYPEPLAGDYIKSKMADLSTLKRARIAELKQKPRILEALMQHFYKSLYYTYRTMFMCLLWLGYWGLEHLHKLATGK